MIEVRNNTITHEIHPDLYFKTIPGQVLLVAPEKSPVIPRWVVNRMRHIPARKRYPEEGYFVLFHAVVIRPGVVRISTILTEDDRAIVADYALHFLCRTHESPLTLFAKEEGKTIFNIKNNIGWNDKGTIFGFADENAINPFKVLDPSSGPVPYDPDED
ncbi:MAG: hypothetical protein AB2603_09655 [Candidatus Thiodiazotropha endolucinida]